MKQRFLIPAIGLSGLLLIQQAAAADLMQVYQQALKNDPSYKKALATQMVVQEQVPQSRALLLPNLSLTGQASLVRQRNEYNDTNHLAYPNSDSRARALGYELKLTQNIFNFTNWKTFSVAKNTVKAASASYNAASLDLIKRTALAYFSILEAQDVLKFTVAEKKSFYQEYVRAYQQFKVGVNTITDVYNAKAAYDNSIADYVSAKNTLANKQEDLRAITGKLYTSFESLRGDFPMPTPSPNNIDSWSDMAVKQNWNLIAARYTAQAAHENIQAAKGNHLPTLDFTAKYDSNYTRNFRTYGLRQQGPSAELDAAIPLYSGGNITSKVREAIANYQLKSNQQEQTYRQVINDTRKAYLGVISGISKVRADKQSLRSYQSSLRGMQEGYKVGTRTMVDVLNAQKSLYDAQKTYATDRYSYIMSTITLKEAAGYLSETDLQGINKWIGNGNNTVPAKKTSVTYKKTHPFVIEKKKAVSSKTNKATATKQAKQSSKAAAKKIEKKTPAIKKVKYVNLTSGKKH